MKYHFEQETGSFIINDYETGKVWENHIWNENQFLTTVNQFGQSFPRLVTANAERVHLTLGHDKSCSMYLRDEDTKDYWNVGYAPSYKKVEDFACEHSQAFTTVSSRRNGIFASHTICIFPNRDAEAWEVKIKNEGTAPRKISVFPFCTFDLDGFVQHSYYAAENTGWTEFVPEANAILCIQNGPFMPADIFSGYMMASEKTDLYCGRLEHFTGTAGNSTKPCLLEDGKDLPCTNAAYRKRSGLLQNKITLAPGEEKTLYYVLGFTSSKPEDLIALRKPLMDEVPELFAAKYERGIKEYGSLRCNTPNERVNNIMNFWVQKQVSYCMIGKKAVRDNAQLALGMLNYDTPLAKKTLAECTANQFFDGHALLNWSPFFREKDTYSDPSAWLILAICQYVKESGDTEFLKEHIPFLDGEDGTVYDHLTKAAEWFMRDDNYGPNRLPRIHHADWNDALNIPDDTAESIFMAMMICLVFKELAELAEFVGDDPKFIETLKDFRQKIADITNQKAYNGEYYVRALSKFGVVGDKGDPNGGEIYVNPQVWGILAEIIPQERISSVMAAVDRMENDGGVPLCYPAYKKYDPSVGRMSAMPSGIFENGGIYNHACAFKVMADCKVGRKEEAMKTLLKMIPDGEYNPSSHTTTEPYVFTNCYQQHPAENMQVGFSWQTGSSAWGLRDFYEGVLGIDRTFAGLKIKPNIPAAWDKVTATRPYRGSILHFTYINKNAGAVSLTVDGKKVEGDTVAPFGDNATHEITVEF
ncbi:MAG: hypothetical protein KBS41_04455 [Oscillospiraceae bacterium]|nr:hypothetical protein [Candidatus Equicaccousia limihippi]